MSQSIGGIRFQKSKELLFIIQALAISQTLDCDMRNKKRHSVLIVDDDPKVQDEVGLHLEQAGFKAICSSDNSEILQILHSGTIDIVVADTKMTVVDSIKSQNISSPVLFFITTSSDTTLKETFDRGGAALFARPVDPTALIGAINTSLKFKEDGGTRKHERFEVKLPVEIILSNGRRLRANVRNISQQGMFVDLVGTIPNSGDPIRFEIPFENKELPTIKGVGVVSWSVQWAEEDATKYPSQTGFGLKFTNFEAKSQSVLMTLLNLLKTKAFISSGDKSFFLW